MRKSAWPRPADHDAACFGDAQADLFRMTEAPLDPTPIGPAGEATEAVKPGAAQVPKEFGGPKGPEPTRYGDWEVKGRCTDF
jgi:hypothetical protein